jgi:hypothetical protein
MMGDFIAVLQFYYDYSWESLSFLSALWGNPWMIRMTLLPPIEFPVLP